MAIRLVKDGEVESSPAVIAELQALAARKDIRSICITADVSDGEPEFIVAGEDTLDVICISEEMSRLAKLKYLGMA